MGSIRVCKLSLSIYCSQVSRWVRTYIRSTKVSHYNEKMIKKTVPSILDSLVVRSPLTAAIDGIVKFSGRGPSHSS